MSERRRHSHRAFRKGRRSHSQRRAGGVRARRRNGFWYVGPNDQSRVHSSFHLVRSVVPHMKRQRYGRIVLTTSGRAMSLDSAAPGLSAYSMGKMAQVGFMFSVAAEVRDFGVRINAISPVAATRVLRRSAPELLPELVAPGAVFLASSRCDASGIVIQAVGGAFATVQCHFSTCVDFGPTPVGPETVAARWLEVAADFQRAKGPEAGSAGS